MKYKKSKLTQFTKNCAWGANQILNGVCIAEEISKDDIGQDIINSDDEELLLEISRRYAKYTKDQMAFDTETGDVQNFQRIIESIVECCEENNWFE